MFIFKSVVGKLWLTIIGLVAVVLIILGIFLFQYIDTSFPKSDDQTRNLQRLAANIAQEVSDHRNDSSFSFLLNELMRTQDAGIALVEKGTETAAISRIKLPVSDIPVSNVYTNTELAEVWAGRILPPKRVTSSGHTLVEDYLVTAVPVHFRDSGNETAALIVSQSMKSVDDNRLYIKKLFAFVSAIGFLLTTFFAFFLITRITRPLSELKKAADFITRGNYGIRVPEVSTDEIGELTRTFNLMGGQLEETITDLNHEKDNLDSVLRSMADAVISFDIDGMVIFSNPPGEEILEKWSVLGWEEPEPGARPLRQIPLPLRQVFESVVSETRELTTKVHVRDGVWSIVMAPLYSRDVVRGAVAVLRDVTEEFRLDKLRKDFVANVSHELRTPLSMLQGYSEALLDDIATSSAERDEMAQVIHDESLRMGRLVKDLLDLARMEAGHMDFHFSQVDLSLLLRRVHRKFSVLCKEQGIQLVPVFGDEAMPLYQADEDRLEQVLTNLLDNAVRHTPAGASIEIRAEQTEWKGEPAVKLEIEDRGQGIPPEDLPFIFERFYKADKARTRGSSGGTGLGLAIVKNIVDAHGGAIQARSTVGEGTTFSIFLPLRSPSIKQ